MDLYKFYKKYGLFVILAIFIVVFSTLNTQFLTPGNLAEHSAPDLHVWHCGGGLHHGHDQRRM